VSAWKLPGLFVAGEEMLPRRQLQSSAFAYKAADADTLQGVQASTQDQSVEVAALEGEVIGLDARVGTLEAIGADITAVTPGSGLVGGGSSGDVVLGVGPAGINFSMLAPNSVSDLQIIDGSVSIADIGTAAVGADEIAEGAVGTSELAFGSVQSAHVADGSLDPVDLNAAASGYTFGGLAVNGSTDINGAFRVVSGADVFIQDDFNGFRWTSFDGTTWYGAILARSTEFSFYDDNNDRYAIHSDAGGVGIGTTLTATGYDVSVPSLSVAGQTAVGYEIVTASYALNSTAVSCHAHGNLTCYFGTATVFCPVGKRVLGGGSSGSTGRWRMRRGSAPRRSAV